MQIADTPIKRTWLNELSNEDRVTFVQSLQERRLALQKIYEAGKKAKEDKADEKQALTIEKSLKKFEVLSTKINQDLEKLERISVDIQAMRLVLGDFD